MPILVKLSSTVQENSEIAPCVGVDVPVEHVSGRGIPHGAVGNQLHVWVVRLDGKVEGDVVAYIGWVSTVLVSTHQHSSSAAYRQNRDNISVLELTKGFLYEAPDEAFISPLPGCHASCRLQLVWGTHPVIISDPTDKS